ncbi:MAG: hypothetical protein K2I81_02785 [Alphaproteobacteria bacterium]|nr:hypothetical protein [Alphaproteobacteria bacterium]
MKKFIFGILIALFVNGTAIAFDCPSGDAMTETTCNAVANCVYNAGSCQKCDNGQYSPANSNKCMNCNNNKPSSADWTGPGNDKGTCPWSITCSAGSYWNGSECVDCKGNQTSSDTTITSDGMGSWPAQNNTCTYKAVLIKLEKNQGVFDIDKQIYAKCEEGFADSEDGPWREQPDITPTLWWGQTFDGYYTDKTGGTQRFDENGELSYQTTDCSFTEETTTLYAHWQQNPYYVDYYYPPDTTAAMRQKCYLGKACTPIEPDSNKAPAKQAFDKWQCISGCSGSINKDDIIPEPKQTNTTTTPVIQLQALWRNCNAGYYCTNGKEEPCPIGSTSAAGSETIGDCHITQDTLFCDGDGTTCFYLPAQKTTFYAN